LAVALPTNYNELKLQYPEEVQKRETAERENRNLKKKLADIQRQEKAGPLKFGSFGKQGCRKSGK
jgi:hypothetical protein